jgi:hypothetical protein
LFVRANPVLPPGRQNARAHIQQESTQYSNWCGDVITESLTLRSLVFPGAPSTIPSTTSPPIPFQLRQCPTNVLRNP